VAISNLELLSNYHAKVTLTTCMLLISAHILDPFQTLQSLRQWGNAMDVNPKDETFKSTKHQEAFLKNMENK
jgi:hypothetical protein